VAGLYFTYLWPRYDEYGPLDDFDDWDG
jgi:hypothetical protein